MKHFLSLLLIVLIFVLVGCSTSPTATATISISVIHDGQTDQILVPANSSVRQALTALSITLNTLDRVEPELESTLQNDASIKVIRVTETYSVEEKTLPFESQTVKNESMSAGQKVLIQAGVNGKQSITYRVLTEDGVEVSRTVTKTETIQSSKPEIIMLGVQSSFKPVEISGTIAYISSSNAWVMEANTGNRRSVVSTGDLDGRIFSISPDKKWLLFTRSAGSDESQTINSLWIASLEDSGSQPISLGVKNVVNYAEWIPNKTNTIAYSTVEFRSTAPGWQANNDLQVVQFGKDGSVINSKTLLEANSGGIYGWWGTTFLWSPDNSEIAYARPDSIGLVDTKSGTTNTLVEFTPYQTSGDWAWVPGIAWADGHAVLYANLPDSDPSGTRYSLNGILIDQNFPVVLQANTGLFSYPSVSPDSNLVAYLTALLPDQSESSSYNLFVMDRDGSNPKKLYPNEGGSGLEPQTVIWSPSSDNKIAFIANGNLLLIDPVTAAINQITGDSSISKIDWK
ncbi:MAG: G5 domain-containing protein [Anaerolineaceae bacterium]|nr:G5 domain-containing protein [Anaerolineaceae bacterium]